jgi:CRP-like cAMP-binding protein
MAIDDDIALLERVPTFSVLGREALRVLVIGSESKALQQGEVLFREGDVADAGYVVEIGSLRAIGRERLMQQVELSRGTLIGETALLVQTRRPMTVMAAEPASVMRIPRALFIKMLQGYPTVARRLQQTLSERTQRFVNDLAKVRKALDVSEEPKDVPPAKASEPPKADEATPAPKS